MGNGNLNFRKPRWRDPVKMIPIFQVFRNFTIFWFNFLPGFRVCPVCRNYPFSLNWRVSFRNFSFVQHLLFFFATIFRAFSVCMVFRFPQDFPSFIGVWFSGFLPFQRFAEISRFFEIFHSLFLNFEIPIVLINNWILKVQ